LSTLISPPASTTTLPAPRSYYGSPLAAAWKVIRTRNSASILLLRLLCDISNSGLWTVYGFMVG
jgi:hypothetical protein